MLETVANFPDLASAQLARSLLEAEGISASIPDEYLSGIDWRLGTAIQGIRLQVAAEYAEEARGLLARTGIDPEEVDESSFEPDAPGDRCPVCGSREVGPPDWKRRLKATTLLFPILIFAWPFLTSEKDQLVCSACGHRWSG